MEKLSAMILAGGRGHRMGVLCQERAKPNLPFAGKFRVMDFVLTNCIRSEIHDIAVLVDYERTSIANYLVQWRLANSVNRNFLVFEPKLNAYKGTADAVYQNSDYLQEKGTDDILILAADHVYKMDYRKMHDFHQKMNADITVAVIPVPIEQAHRFGIVKLNAEGRIVEFTEKPNSPQTNMASMGIYIINKRVLLRYLIEDAADPSSPHDFGHAILPKLVWRNRAFAYRSSGYWQDIGTIQAYYLTNMELIHETPAFSVNTRWSILTLDNSNSPQARISGQGSVIRSLISSGCVIKGRVENSILSEGVRIEENAIVKNSVILANTSIDQHSIVDCSILDEGVNIGKFCYIGFGNTIVSNDQNITVVGNGATVPSYTAIGHSCQVLPGVEMADFLKNAIPSGAVVSHR